MYNINNFTAVCAKYVHFTLHLLCCLLVHPDKFLILCKWLLRYYYWTYYSDMRHGDRPHNYVSNYIFGFAISSGLTKILPIEKCIIFFETPCMLLFAVIFIHMTSYVILLQYVYIVEYHSFCNYMYCFVSHLLTNLWCLPNVHSASVAVTYSTYLQIHVYIKHMLYVA